MRGSDIGSFGPQWALGLLPFLLIEQKNQIILSETIIARCAQVQKTPQMPVAFL